MIMLNTQAQLSRHFRGHVGAQLYDDSGAAARGSAIYSLSDPRDIRAVRYVGLSNAPKRRFLQHLNTARLWLPDDTPWWVKSPQIRPLSEWIRALYRDDYRLPVMVISAWVETVAEARVAERTRIYACLEQRLQLLNVETEILGPQLPLI
jgi:hypothetical protein